MKVFFLLSGEHKTLPKAEVIAVLESIGADFKVLEHFEQVLVLETDRLDDIHERLAMSHRICEFFGECDNNSDDILELAERTKIEAGDTFAVRVKRVKGHGEGREAERLERKIGEIIKDKTGAKVNLTSPKNVFYGVLSEKFIFGKVRREINRSQYEGRRPHKRPYFHPGAMLPRNCRAIVNLTRVKKGNKFLDPFCGAGGFLIEAGLIGAKVYGRDIDSKAVSGCKKNLEHYKVKGYCVEVGDAREIKGPYRNYFDAVAADLPYGIQSSTRGTVLEELYKEALESIFAVLKSGGYACVIGPKQVDIEDTAGVLGFKVVEVHFERIHRSLTRKIAVLQK